MRNIFANTKIAIVLIAMFFATQTYGQEPKQIPNSKEEGVVKLPTFIDCGTSEAIDKGFFDNSVSDLISFDKFIALLKTISNSEPKYRNSLEF